MNVMIVAGCVLSAYVLIVLATEALVWRVQPSMEGAITLVIQTGAGSHIQRTVYGHTYDGKLYVSSNHWFRSWYRAALANPKIAVGDESQTQPYTVHAVLGEEHARVLQSYDMGFFLRLLCGFAPRKLLRLEPA